MATNNYKQNTKEMGKFLRSQVLGDAMHDVAKDGLSYARSISPVVSGGYRDSLYTEQVMVEVGRKNDKRAGAMIATDIPYNAAVENEHHVLARTADHLRGSK